MSPFGLSTKTYIPLAITALLYRLSWPIVEKLISDCSPRFPKSSSTDLCDVVSLTTKFLFVFIALSCAIVVLPALLRNPTFEPCDRGAGLEQIRYYTAVLLCLLVTSINCGLGWRLEMGLIRRKFMRGSLGFDDLGLFDRVAMVASQVGLSAVVLAGLVYMWVEILKSWNLARRINERERSIIETKTVGMEKSWTDIPA